jgi:hypothetical protein
MSSSGTDREPTSAGYLHLCNRTSYIQILTLVLTVRSSIYSCGVNSNSKVTATVRISHSR